MRTTTFTFIDYLPDGVREFPRRRFAEIVGLTLLVAVAAGTVALLSWSAGDPSLNHATATPAHNWLGRPGAIAADLLMQFFGIGCTLLLAIPAFWGWRLVTRRRLERARLRLALGLLGLLCGVAAASLAPVPGGWPLPTGLGGVVGDALLVPPRALSHGSNLEMMIVGAALVATAILTLSAAVGAKRAEGWEEPQDAPRPAPRRQREVVDSEEDDNAGEMGFGLVSLGAAIHTALMLKGALRRMLARRPKASLPPLRAPWLNRESPKFTAPLDEEGAIPAPAAAGVAAVARALDLPSVVTEPRGPAGRAGPVIEGVAQNRVMPGAGPLKAGKRATTELQLNLFRKEDFEFPPLAILAEPKKNPQN